MSGFRVQTRPLVLMPFARVCGRNSRACQRRLTPADRPLYPKPSFVPLFDEAAADWTNRGIIQPSARSRRPCNHYITANHGRTRISADMWPAPGRLRDGCNGDAWQCVFTAGDAFLQNRWRRAGSAGANSRSPLADRAVSLHIQSLVTATGLRETRAAAS